MKNIFSIFLITCSIRRTCHLFYANPIRSLIYGTVIIVFVVEAVIYYGITFTWNGINCRNRENCTRILLAADPQIIGLHNEPFKHLTPISIWDSDRFLSKTFSHAFHFVKPDVVIFLGDLFDEGSTASNDEFKIYHNRLFNIFAKDRYNSVAKIWLPGDNDIGGEGSDVITKHKVQRFENTFQQPDVINLNNIIFYNVNELTSSIPEVENQHDHFDNVVIGLSHFPLLKSGTVFVDKVLHTLKPHLFFTAHRHEVKIYQTHNDGYQLLADVEQDEKSKVYKYNLDFNKTVYEINVPTCSYRMGTSKIGYGFAVIEGSSVSFTVLWSPGRFPQLIFYGMTVLFILIYAICRRRSSSCSKKYLREVV